VLRTFRFGFFAVFFACSSQSGSFDVTLGGESDTVTRSPSVSTYIIEAVDRSANRQTLKNATWTSGGTLDLGELSQSTVASIQLTGSDGNGTAIIWGAVPFAVLGAFNGLTIPLFVQRKGEFARMPGTTYDGRNAPLLATSARGVYIAGGGNLPLAAYDMLMLDGFPSTCPAAPSKSFALVISPKANTDGESAMAWRIDDSGLSVVGLAQCTLGYETLVHLDSGTSWSDFAGGRTVMGDDGSAYVVGPSRTTGASGTILKIAPDPTASTMVDAVITSVALTTRTGAATAWAPGRGIFVYGGASQSTKGGEIVAAAGTVTEIDVPADPRQDLAAIAFDQTKTMLVAGDDQQPLLVDLSCGGCAPTKWGVAPSVKLSSPSLFALGKDSKAFLLIGDDSTSATRAFRLSEKSTDEKPLKIGRTGARGIQVETGQIVVIGGGSSTPESYAD
jgi:hypothetical protein